MPYQGMARMAIVEEIHTEAVPECYLCHTTGRPLYSDVHDRIFSTPGEWSFSRCPRCGLIWLNPRPLPADLGKIYKNYYTHAVHAAGSTFLAYLKNARVGKLVRETFLRHAQGIEQAVLASRMGYSCLPTSRMDRVLGHIMALLPGFHDNAWLSVLGLKSSECGKLLDVGCGNGVFLARMRKLGWDVVGVEPDGQAADIARRQFGLEVFEGTLEQAGFPDRSFEAVSLSHVIEHVYDPAALLRECRRVLKPGGKLVIVTPNTNSLGHKVFRESWRGLEPPRHARLFHPEGLVSCVGRAGMQVKTVKTVARMMRNIWYASRLIQRANQDQHARNTLMDYIGSYVMHILAAVICVFRKDAGEEIVLVADRE